VRGGQAGRRFCDIVCKYAVLRDAQGKNRFGRKDGRGEFECQECGARIALHKYLARRRRFCSPECAKKWRVRHKPAAMVSLSCVWCGKEFQRHQSYIDHNGGRVKFCSKECNGAFTARYKQNRVSAAETAFLDAVEAAGLAVNRQVRIKGFVVDAVCAERNVVIEFDGEYWHSFTHVLAKDERKADAVAWAGYKLVRVRERDYLTDPEATVAAVVRQSREV
jgi:very-short-patch-repair endonuclease